MINIYYTILLKIIKPLNIEQFFTVLLMILKEELRHDKACFRDFRPGPTKTGLYSNMAGGLKCRILKVEGLY